MLCRVCVCMLRGGTGQMWMGTFDLTFEHHRETASLRRSREGGCTICIALANELRSELDLLEDQPISVNATLRKIKYGQHHEHIYHLEFDLDKKRTRTFVLKPTSLKDRRLRTPRSLNTSSDEVFEIAHKWISECRCADHLDEPGKKWYPKRLLDLDQLRKANGLRALDGLAFLSEHANIERTKVRLVETKEVSMLEKENPRYVTLSHCWGKPKSVQGQLKLNSRTEKLFKTDGIELRELPKSFRDAMLFACRLENVGYIWIDSLCIKQLTTGVNPMDSEDDWLEQSRLMHQVYSKSFLNISATAATDGDKGLFYPRRPEYLWEDEINLNFTGTESFSSFATASHGMDNLTRCTLIDVSFWDKLVEEAPVNQRGWVLQERLMAPRILHFCSSQIAWECAEFQDAEGHPEKDPTLKAKLGNVVDEPRLKSLTREDGLKLRKLRLNGYPDPDEHMNDIHVFEHWKRIVEVYSRTKLTVSRDKLIALSGVAQHFSEKTKSDYVVGMWRKHLESQLLWRVNEVFKDGSFENPARRDPLRAPSFSWASIDSPHGVIYGEATDYGSDRDRAENLFFEVVPWVRKNEDHKKQFDLVLEKQLLLKARYLQQITIRKLDLPMRVPYSWYIHNDRKEPPSEYYNLYLDAPDSDVDIFTRNARLYCMPAAFGERTVKKSSRYLLCLLLKLEETSTASAHRLFKRIGLAKLSNYADGAGQKALMKKEVEVNETILLC